MALSRLIAVVRKCVAVGVAQVFALQLLLVSFAAGQIIVAGQQDSSPFTICYGDHTTPAPAGNDDKAPGHLHHVPCVLCSLATGSAAIPSTNGSHIPFRHAAVASYDIADVSTVVSPHPSPRSSQGPPRNA